MLNPGTTAPANRAWPPIGVLEGLIVTGTEATRYGIRLPH